MPYILGMQPLWLSALADWARSRRAATPELNDGGLLSRTRLCRRIQGLGVRDKRHRTARLLQKMLADPSQPAVVRIEAARTLGRWDPALALPAVENILRSRREIPFLKDRLSQAAQLWRSSRQTPVQGLQPWRPEDSGK